jgi:hypothetical protein
MRGAEHRGATIDAVVDDKEVVVAWEAMLVYAVKAALKRRRTESIAGGDKACILYQVSDSDF